MGENGDNSETTQASKQPGNGNDGVTAMQLDVDVKEPSPAGGGFMTVDDELLHEERRQQQRGRAGAEAGAAAIEPSHNVQPSIGDAAAAAVAAEEPASSSEISTSQPSTIAASTSPAKSGGLTVDTQSNGARRSSSPSNVGRMMPERKSSPPPTPPARLSSSEGRVPLRRTSSGGSSSSPNAASARLQGLTGSVSPLGAASRSPESNSMKRSVSPLMPGTGATRGNYSNSSNNKRLSPSSSSSNGGGGAAGGSSSPPPAKEARTSRSSSPPLDSANLHVPGTSSYKAKSRSPSPGRSNRSAGRSSSPKSEGSSSPQIGPQPDSEVRANGRTSSSPPTEEARSSSPAWPPVPTPPRRVKIYALLNSNWMDLGTGSCTYHRGIASRKRRRIGDSSSSSQQQSGKISISGRAARDAAARRRNEEYVEEVEFIEMDPFVFRDSDARREELPIGDLEPGEEEAAWIEVVKEGRWKSDPPAPSKKERKRARQKKLEEAKENGSELAESQTESDDMESDGGPEYQREWQARIEKPIRDALGLLDIDCFTPQPGADGENEEVIGRYRRQQDTLIVWKSSSITSSLSSVLEGGDDDADEEEEMEVAMSFAATSGCAEVWEFLKEVHKRWELQYLHSQEGEEDAEAELLATNHYNTHPSTSAFGSGQNGQYGLGLGAMTGGPGPLPVPELSNLAECDKRIKFSSRTQVGREKLASTIMRTDFIRKLFDVFREAEDLESIQDLHALCHMMHDILNLNDQTIWEYVLEDDNFFDIVSILEYDPDFPTMKATYRTHLSDPNIFVEVVPVGDIGIEHKIHEVYRLQYMKDVILPRVLDDSAFTIINSFIYFHQVDIVQYLCTNERFWKELFAIFPDVSAASAVKANETKPSSNSSQTNGSQSKIPNSEVTEKQINAVAFLQSYAQMVKQLQPGMRATTFRKLSEAGVLRILGHCLTSPKMAANQAVRVASVEILMLIVDHDTASIRAFVLKENGAGKKKTLLLALIEAFHGEEELGIKAQLAEAIRVLVLPAGEVLPTETAAARTKPDDQSADSFMQYFYDNCMHELLEPLIKTLQAPADDSQDIELAPVQIAHVTHLCDLLCFFVIQHSFRSKFFIISTNVGSKVSLLLRAKPKHVRLASLRFFRACLGRNDDFYNRYLVKNNCLAPILSLTQSEIHANNLLSSACLELFEYVRVNNVKTVLNNIMEKQGDKVSKLAEQFTNFRMLLQRYEQNKEPPPPDSAQAKAEDALSSSTAAAEPSSSIETDAITTKKLDERSLSTEEERYFDADDDDEPPESQSMSSLKRSGTSTLLSRFTPASADSPVKKEESDENSRRKRQKLNDQSSNATGTSSASDTAEVKEESPAVEPEEALPEPETDPEQELARIREKRKREEAEEEEEDAFSRKKGGGGAKVVAHEGGKKQGVAGNATGKLKLLFGKKAT